MSRRYYSSTFVSTTTAGSVQATDGTVTLSSVAGLPASVPWTGVFERGTSNEDLVTVTNVSGSTLTITRGVDGQTAKAHGAGVAFDHVVSARDFDEPNNHINTTTRDDHTQYAKAGQGLAANVGAASRAGRLYIATDTEDLYSDDGTTVHRYLSKPSADAAYVVRAQAQGGQVFTTETTTSNAYVDLATVGPAVTVTVPASGQLLISLSAKGYNSVANSLQYMHYTLSGANTAGAGDGNALALMSASTTDGPDGSKTILLAGLTPGSTTITCKYRVGTGTTASFSRRWITVIPL